MESPAKDRDLVIKVKYGDTLKRFNAAYVNGQCLDINLTEIRSKIISAFKFSPDTDLILTYTDEDGDTVILDDDDDLRDAAISQKLNPIRINVQLKHNDVGAPEPKLQTPNPASLTPPMIGDPLAQAISSLDEALKSLPEPIHSTISTASRDLLVKAASAAPALADYFSKLAISRNSQPSAVPAGDSPGPSSSEMNKPVPNNGDDEPNLLRSSAAKNVTKEAPQNPQASTHPSVEELLFPGWTCFTNANGNESGGAQDKGTSAVSTDPRPSPPAAPPMGDHTKSCALPRGYIEPPRPSFQCGSAPPSRIVNPSLPHISHPARFYPFGHPYRVPGLNHANMLPAFHTGIQCDGCGIQPITGTRYKSLVKEDYDLCSVCFSQMGTEGEYTRIDRPLFPDRHQRLNSLPRGCGMRQKRSKLESRFIQDVTILDGTTMAPSTPFTKIWRMRNNGTTLWPFGTRLLWVGGDQFASQTSVQLQIPSNGLPMDEEIDIAVDFTAPSRLGRYISYWRLATPTGQKFGQRVWVLIQVDQSDTPGSGTRSPINLNLPPEGSRQGGVQLEGSRQGGVQLIDVNAEPVDDVAAEPKSKQSREETLEPATKNAQIKISEPALNDDILGPTVAVAPPALPPVITLPPSSPSMPPPLAVSLPALYPIIDLQLSSPSLPPPVAVSFPASYPLIDLPPSSSYVPPAVAVSLPASFPIISPPPSSSSIPPPVFASAPDEANLDGNLEEEEVLMKELEEMGFKQVDLNKEVLRLNNYDLEQSVDDLCGFAEWDPLLQEMQEMGFNDKELNKKVLVKNGGSIKRAVLDLVTGEKTREKMD